MILIDKRYLKDERTKNDSIVRSEILAAILINKYVYNVDKLYVGTDPNKKFPDIHNNATIGFEVVRCEAQVDFLHTGIVKELIKINYDYAKYIKIKNEKPNHIFNKANISLSVINNIIVSSSVICTHGIDWMIQQYKKTINKKLEKLNKGNYKSCKNISLIMLNFDRANGILNAKQVQKCYYEEAQNFTFLFDFIYYITIIGIYKININECFQLKKFNHDEFSLCVKEMKQMLQIDEYKNF